MKKSTIVIGVAVAALVSASIAIAAPPVGKGKPATTGVGCKPAVQVVLKGTLAGAPGAGTSFTVTVKSGNSFAKRYVSTAPLTITLTPDTKIRRQGAKSAASLLVGDRVLVQARVCKADLTGATAPSLTARMIVAHPATA
jgi:hypothetical protein